MRRTCVYLLVASVLIPAASQAQDKWGTADSSTRRLAPSGFRELPESVRAELDRRGCAVPQPWPGTSRVNVIRGRFISGQAVDWAVLCSVNRVSRILVFAGERPDSVVELAASPDRMFLQTVTEDQIGYSRAIAVVTAKAMRKYLAGECGGEARHDGINDAFVGKASTVRYWCRGKWLELSGAD